MKRYLTTVLLLIAGGTAPGVLAQILVPFAPDARASKTLSSPAAESRTEAESGGGRHARAQLTPRSYTTLAAEIGAKIIRLPVSEGGVFEAGQTLIAFDCSVQQAQLSKAEAALASAESVLQSNRRLEELNSVGKLELNVSRAEVDKNRAEVATMAAMLAKCTVSAPFAGRIAEQKVREQQFVQPGQALLDILDDSVLEIEFIVPSRWLAWLKTGHAFRIRIDETGKTYPARIHRIGARVDSVSQTIKIVAAIDGRFAELLAGMSGQANFSGSGTGETAPGKKKRSAP